jgi:hypothetical protein
VSGAQKVRKWLESVEVPEGALNEISSREEFKFASVKKLAESFSTKDKLANCKKSAVRNNRKVSDCSIVQAHIANYNSLNRSKTNNISNQSTNETDSGIENSFKTPEKLLPFRSAISFHHHHQFSCDGELV